MDDRRRPLRWHAWGVVPYRDAVAMQDARWAAVVAREADDAIFTLQHPPVITVGRRGSLGDLVAPAETLAARGIDVVKSERGGELTYHGPGQLVLYPIVDIAARGVGVADLVRGLAAAVASTLATRGVHASYDAGRPGLWVGDAKICAVGMRISKNVSRHGAAVNLTTALDAYELFVPCGMPEAAATSVLRETGEAPDFDAFAADTVRAFSAWLGAPLLRGEAALG